MMKKDSQIGFDILRIALVIGLLADLLLRAVPWGLNVFMFNGAFVGAFAFLTWKRNRRSIDRTTTALLLAQMFFAGMFVWRDSIALRFADSVAIVLILSLQLLPQLRVPQRFAGAFHYILGFLWSSLNALCAPVMLIAADIEWSQLPTSGWRKHAFAAVRGFAIALPLVLVFGGLFIAADVAYEGLAVRLLNIDPSILLSHVFLFCAFAWLSMGYLRGALIRPIGAGVPSDSAPDIVQVSAVHFSDVRRDPGESPVTLPNDRTIVDHLNVSDPPDTELGDSDGPATLEPASWDWPHLSNAVLPPAFTLGTTEVVVILGLMNLLFLSFVVVQIPYLFGGMDLVRATPDFKLAEYARRGFGELVAVSFLVLPTLLAGQWLIRREAVRAERVFRILASTQIILLFVIMASAVQRLLLLTGSLGYGLTTIRLYPMIFMCWLALLFVWFGSTVLRGRRQNFAWGALWSAFVILGATHAFNPDAFIVNTNVALAQDGRMFDASYYSDLSSDAIPSLLDSLPQLDTQSRCEVGSILHYAYRRLGEENDIRSLNYSRRHAFYLLRQNDALLHQTDGCPPELSNYADRKGG